MFNKQSKVDAMDTIIGPESELEGKIKSKSSLRIEGKIYGEVDCDGDVTIDEKGYVENQITSRNLTISGEVKGNIKASGKLHIRATGKFTGNAEVQSLVIDEGGIFDGENKMKEQKEDSTIPITKATKEEKVES